MQQNYLNSHKDVELGRYKNYEANTYLGTYLIDILNSLNFIELNQAYMSIVRK